MQIYIITNKLNGKQYVGQSRNYLDRWTSHCSYKDDYSCLLHNAIRKYGKDNFTIELLEDNIPIEEIDQREKYYIDYYNTFTNGYNMTTGGQGVHGYRHTNNTKQKISNNSEKMWTEIKRDESRYNEIMIKRSKSLKGKKFSESHRKAISEAAKKRLGSKNSFYGKRHSQETKDLIGKKNSKSIVMVDPNSNEIIREFTSIKKAVKYLLEIGKTTSIQADHKIVNVCKGRKEYAYGFRWRYSSSVTTNPDECKDVE